MEVSKVKRLKSLEEENVRLKKHLIIFLRSTPIVFRNTPVRSDDKT